MFDVAFKNLWSRKTRSILCILTVVVSVFLNGPTATMNNWMYESVTAELARYMGVEPDSEETIQSHRVGRATTN